MKNFKYYIRFCNKFNKHYLPKLKFRILDERYNYFYRRIYNIDEDDINRASFFICIVSFSIIVLLSLAFLKLDLSIIIIYSLILSFMLSFRFNLTLFHEVNKMETKINTILYLIKINFSLIQKTLKNNADSCVNFIKLIKEYQLPILGNFKYILKRIHEGYKPEDELFELLSPSKDFNQYLRHLLINNFDNRYEIDEFKEGTLEKDFKVYLREIQSKISIIFFIGIFFPIGLCFLILFQVIDLIIAVLLIPFFLYILNFLCRKYVKKNTYLIGVLEEYSSLEKKKFNEFLLFLESFAINLKNNISPERAFLKSYTQNKNLFVVLNQTIKSQISSLLNFKCSFHDMIQFFKLELKSMRYNVILDAIEKFVAENANYSSTKIFEILHVVHKHQELEKKREVVIKGEKFKIFFFLFLLPLLIGTISGMFPFFVLITSNINSITSASLIDFSNLISIYNIFLIFFVFISSLSITSINFLKIINIQKKFLIILISNLLFILTFLISFTNILNLI